jgi:hypothetical protein
VDVLTMTDLGFLPQTLTLYRSLVAHAGQVELTVLCMDVESRAYLAQRRLPGVEILELGDLERADDELAARRAQRTWREYCWTVIPAFCHHVLLKASVGDVVTWVDAEVEFLRDPTVLLDELGDGSFLLTPHCYNRAYPISAPDWELTARFGRFNGGMIAFRRDQVGLTAARLWRDRTLEWCFDRCEPGRFGNQLHLDDFAQRDGARIIAVPGGVLGPWNGGRYRVRPGRHGPTADGRPVTAYHYQSVRLCQASPWLGRRLPPNVFALPGVRPSLQARAEPHYRLSLAERRLFWSSYVRRLGPAVAEVLAAQPRFAELLGPRPTRSEVLDRLHQRWSLETSRIVAPHQVSGLRAAVRGRLPGR